MYFFSPQCHTVKITIVGEEGVPVQVDGEAWVQPPGFLKIVHKNRAQMLVKDKVGTEGMGHEGVVVLDLG